VPHTSEVGLRVWGRTWEAFYAAAARGLLTLYGIGRIGRTAPGEMHKEKVVLRSKTAEEMLVSWLNELNFHITTRGRIPVRLAFESAGPDKITAELKMLPINALGRPLKGEIKAASYHDLEVRRRGGRWTATIILDV